MSRVLIDPETEEQVKARHEGEPPADTDKSQDKSSDEDNIPEKYRGKTAEEIIAMHSNAESELGRMRNELGHMRSLVADLSQIKRQEDLGKVENDDDDFKVTSDSLLDDPETSISKIVQRALKKELEPIRQKVESTEAETAESQFIQKYGDITETANDPKFQKWVTDSEVRLRDAVAARDGDLAAAERLLDNWNDRQDLLKSLAEKESDDTDTGGEKSSDGDKPRGREGARRAATGGEGSADASRGGKPLWYKHDVMKVLENDPDKYYSESYQRQMIAAIREGRYVE